MNLHRFTVSLDPDDAVNATHMTHRYRDKDLGRALRRTNVFDTEAEAQARRAELIAETEGDLCSTPGHECGRCRNWPPKVYEVTITVAERST